MKKGQFDPLTIGIVLLIIISLIMLALVSLGKGDLIIEFFRKLGGS